jgi:hypothetical protein
MRTYAIAIICAAVFLVNPLATQDQPTDEDTNAETAAEPEPAPTEDEPAAASDPDVQLFLSIKENIGEYVATYEDSTVLQNKKKRQFAAKAKDINSRLAGRQLAFKSLCVLDVEPQTEFTAYGQNRAKQIIRKLRRDPQTKPMFEIWGADLQDNPMLAWIVAMYMLPCKKCFRQTGRYEVKFTTSSNGECGYGLEGNTVVLTVPSESKALSYKKGQKYPVSGKVKGVTLKDQSSNVDTTIYLE